MYPVGVFGILREFGCFLIPFGIISMLITSLGMTRAVYRNTELIAALRGRGELELMRIILVTASAIVVAGFFAEVIAGIQWVENFDGR